MSFGSPSSTRHTNCLIADNNSASKASFLHTGPGFCLFGTRWTGNHDSGNETVFEIGFGSDKGKPWSSS